MMNLPIIYRFLSVLTKYNCKLPTESKYYAFRQNVIHMKATEFYDVCCEWFDSCNQNTKVVYKRY